MPAPDPQGDPMTKEPVDSPQPSEEQPSGAPASPSPRRRSVWPKILLAVVIVAIGLAAVHQTGWLSVLSRSAVKTAAEEPLPATFAKINLDDLFSTGDVLKLAGRSPGDPGCTAFPSMEKAVVPEPGATACPPLSPGAPPLQAPPAPEPTEEGAKQPPAVSARPVPAPKPVETPVISPREPAFLEPQAKRKPASSPADERPEAVSTGPTATGRPSRGPGPSSTTPEDKTRKAGTPVASQPPTTPTSDRETVPADQDSGKQKPFQLPGSLRVTIHNYAGTSVKWGMMVILDDSRVMAAKSKAWNPSRSAAAAGFVEKLPGALTTGSKMAVRDFLCKKTGSEKKAGPCLSHMLLDWSADPAKQLKEKLAALEPAGTTNPCAAVAYSAKKDLGEIGTLVPRMLMVTCGSAKCDHKSALAALQKTGFKEKIAVDVVALGMGTKRQRGYSELAKKTGGLFIRADNPADMDRALSRYEKILKKKTVEKVEVRGEKATFILDLNEEITVHPGTYTVILPTVAGVPASNRTISNVKIGSGEARVLDVRVRKGKLHVRAGKK